MVLMRRRKGTSQENGNSPRRKRRSCRGAVPFVLLGTRVVVLPQRTPNTIQKHANAKHTHTLVLLWNE